MIIGCGFICMFMVLINTVSLQVIVHTEAVVGGSVVLPCSSSEHDLKLQDTDVHWRHNGSENVHDIIKGEDSVKEQDPRYKNRSETFPDNYLRGNFSIKINNLQYTDAGEFSCIITHSSELQTVQLIINEKEETDSGSVETPLNAVSIVIIVLVLSIISICISIAFYRKRKCQANPFSPVRS